MDPLNDGAFIAYHSTVASGIVTETTEVNLKVFPVEWFYER